MLYNVPARTAVDMLPATVARLSHFPGSWASKRRCRRRRGVRELRGSAAPPDFVVLSGDDASAREAIAGRARGVISVTANVAPRAMADMVAAALRGDAGRGQELDAPLAALHRDLFLEANPIPAKWALAQMGSIGPGLRLPLTAAGASVSRGRALQRAPGAAAEPSVDVADCIESGSRMLRCAVLGAGLLRCSGSWRLPCRWTRQQHLHAQAAALRGRPARRR